MNTFKFSSTETIQLLKKIELEKQLRAVNPHMFVGKKQADCEKSPLCKNHHALNLPFII